MNKILIKINNIIDENLNKYLPKIDKIDLEENGKIYYMNGKNGTEFDWYVNNKISDFMVFYNDKNNLGAIKATLYDNASVSLYIYDNEGKTLVKEVSTEIEANEKDIFQLAVILENEADDKHIWDASIDSIITDTNLSNNQIEEFTENKKYYDEMITRKILLNQKAIVSKRITEEGWKTGYMERNEPHDENDSGWLFMAGNENDEYVADYHNLDLISIGYIWQQLDADIFRYINNPVGTRLIRISSSEFEIDKNDKDIYVEKREQ